MQLDVQTPPRPRERLAALDPLKGTIVELRFFGGLHLEEIAECLHVAPSSTLLAEGDASLELATHLFSVGDLLAQFGDYRAEALLLRSLEIRRHLLPPEHPALFEAETTLAFFYTIEERFGDAIDVYNEALERANRLLGTENMTTLDLQNNLAVALAQNGAVEETFPILLQVRDRITRQAGDHSLRMALLWMSLGEPA